MLRIRAVFYVRPDKLIEVDVAVITLFSTFGNDQLATRCDWRVRCSFAFLPVLRSPTATRIEHPRHTRLEVVNAELLRVSDTAVVSELFGADPREQFRA